MGTKRNNPVGCCEPVQFGTTRWHVKMDSTHNPSYYLVNRITSDHPRVCLQKDLVGLTASIWFDNEHQAQAAIISYIAYHSARGAEVPGYICNTIEPTTESKVMEFV